MEEQQERKQNSDPDILTGAGSTSQEADQGRTMAGFSYLIFFLPLLICPQNGFARFHANQSLILLITCAAGNMILRFIPVIGWILCPLFGIAMFALGVLGMVNGFGGKEERLPVIGGFDLIRK